MYCFDLCGEQLRTERRPGLSAARTVVPEPSVTARARRAGYGYMCLQSSGSKFRLCASATMPSDVRDLWKIKLMQNYEISLMHESCNFRVKNNAGRRHRANASVP